MSKYTYLILVASILVGQASAETKVLMGVMGDSISAATFANHDLVQSSLRAEAVHLPPATILPFLGNWENKDTYSWASGSQVSSHFLRLQAWLAPQGQTLDVLNEAVPGSKTQDLLTQADALVQAMAGGQYTALKYVTLMIGANDACSTETATGTPEDQMVSDVEGALRDLAKISQNEPIRVLVSAVPKIPDLARDEILNTQSVAGMTCAQLRDRTIHECDPMTQWTTQDEYAAKIAIVDAKNKALQTVVTEMTHELPQLSIVYTDVFYQTTILPSYMARDCFHPGTRGQGELSRRLWDAQPWFK